MFETDEQVREALGAPPSSEEPQSENPSSCSDHDSETPAATAMREISRVRGEAVRRGATDEQLARRESVVSELIAMGAPRHRAGATTLLLHVAR